MSHALLIAALISLHALSASLLVSLPEPERPTAVREHAFHANLGYYGDVDITKKPELIAPVIDATSAIAVDAQSGYVLYKKQASERLPIASITKLMTALLVLEKGDLDAVVEVSDKAAAIEGSKVWLYPGDKLTVRDLLKIALVGSGNDGAYALAEHVAGSEEAFVELMNARALELNLGSTTFSNAVGFDNEDNYSTAFEITLLARELIKHEFFREVVGSKEASIISQTGQKYRVESTNDLLGNPYYHIFGIKTGTTPAAGQSLVSAGKNDQGHDVIVVVLNSPDRFRETKVIYDWVFRAYTWN